MQYQPQTILVTGGAGFIGSAFVRIASKDTHFIILDSMTYAADQERLKKNISQIRIIKENICNEDIVIQTLTKYQPNAIIHFAAESHVDRSIDAPQAFLKTNVEGTMNLLKCATTYWQTLNQTQQDQFRFLHVSTDEVYGSLGFEDKAFTEDSPYRPNSPYAASKAASDHFVRAWNKTFKLPTIITHCSNNYGPWQFPEKLIPLMITKCLKGEPLPIYGDGSNMRDWIHVDDHVDALWCILSQATPGTVWGIGGETEISNLTLVKSICIMLDELQPRLDGCSYLEQISFVQDRPGHDIRYAVDISHLKANLLWEPKKSFKEGLKETLEWYLSAQTWIENVSCRGGYQGQTRLGIGSCQK